MERMVQSWRERISTESTELINNPINMDITSPDSVVLDHETWWKLSVSSVQLDLRRCLGGGQAFHWIEVGSDQWCSVLDDMIVSIREIDGNIFFSVHECSKCQSIVKDVSRMHSILCDYFRLNVDEQKLLAEWTSKDGRFGMYLERAGGVRVLRQNPFVALLSFICSSNNNIGRISKMVDHLFGFGDLICEHHGRPWHRFPRVAQLANLAGLEEDLVQKGFGYRSRYIVDTVSHLNREYGVYAEEWLLSLRSVPYVETMEILMKFRGVGRKVADCVSLFGLDKLDVVPIDVHMWRIAARDYGIEIAGKTLTDRNYAKIQAFFGSLFGLFAGWAHVVLYVGNLSRGQRPARGDQLLK